jgi:AraC-like DNA-binding protein
VTRDAADPLVTWTQLEPGQLLEDRKSIDLGLVELECRDHAVACKGEGAVRDGYTFIGLTAGTETGTRWSGLAFSDRDVGTTRSHVDLCSTGPVKFYTVSFRDGDVCEEYRRSHFVPDFLDRIPADPVLLRNSYVRQLRTYVDGILTCRPWMEKIPKETLESNVLWFLGAAVVEADETLEPSRPHTRRILAVRQCQEYIEAHMGDPVTLLDLSEISGLRPRSLISAFEAVTGTSPMAYLRARRLGEVRKTLESAKFPRMRIIDVAADWGFWHMGHFTAAYRAMFGETPSQTLTRTTQTRDGDS